ncbi:MAG: hypothetical protein GY820_19495 [Gammaproteobacteria bacterium]|nr:hypothetical protein [Gammaproteobacteria bacterium]
MTKLLLHPFARTAKIGFCQFSNKNIAEFDKFARRTSRVAAQTRIKSHESQIWRNDGIRMSRFVHALPRKAQKLFNFCLLDLRAGGPCTFTSQNGVLHNTGILLEIALPLSTTGIIIAILFDTFYDNNS